MVALTGFLKGFSDTYGEIKKEERTENTRQKALLAKEARDMEGYKTKLAIKDQFETQKAERDLQKRTAESKLKAQADSMLDAGASIQEINTFLADNDMPPVSPERAKQIRQNNPTLAGQYAVDKALAQWKGMRDFTASEGLPTPDFPKIGGGSSDTNITIEMPGQTPTAPPTTSTTTDLQERVTSFSSVNRQISQMKELAQFVYPGQETLSSAVGTGKGILKTIGGALGVSETAEAVSEETIGKLMSPEQRGKLAEYTAQRNIMIGKVNATVALLGRLSDFDAKTITKALQGLESGYDKDTIIPALEIIQAELNTSVQDAIQGLIKDDVLSTIKPEERAMLMEFYKGNESAQEYNFTGKTSEEIKEEYKSLPSGTIFVDPRDKKIKRKP